MAYFVSCHEETFGWEATWAFFERGHGKSVCDGIGGVAKRLADQASKDASVTMNDARDVYNNAWKTKKEHPSVLLVKIGV